MPACCSGQRPGCTSRCGGSHPSAAVQHSLLRCLKSTACAVEADAVELLLTNCCGWGRTPFGGGRLSQSGNGPPVVTSLLPLLVQDASPTFSPSRPSCPIFLPQGVGTDAPSAAAGGGGGGSTRGTPVLGPTRGGGGGGGSEWTSPRTPAVMAAATAAVAAAAAGALGGGGSSTAPRSASHRRRMVVEEMKLRNVRGRGGMGGGGGGRVAAAVGD